MSDISAELESGYIYAIVGENGAGKTMLFQTILQENARYSGDIFVYGQPVRGKHDKMMQIIGYVSEDNIFFEDRTGNQNAEILGILYDDFDKDLFKCVMEKMQAP
ncbi:MAG: ATP-binding cassette domain-containing protein, partial [Clostridium sp.]|nr:ATP-binding cassette domain-containing protein [Clostridium sp.]